MKKSGFLFLFFFFDLIGLVGLKNHLAYAQESNDSLRYYHYAIVKPKDSRELNSAFLFFEKEIKKQLDKGDTISAVQNLRRIAIGQFQLGFLYESEATTVEGIKLLERLDKNEKTIESKRGLTNHLGLVYRKLKFLDKSLAYYKDALSLASGTTDSIVVINNISNVYIDQKKYDIAIKNFLLAYRKSKKQKDILRSAMALDNLGFAQSKIGLPEALSNMQTALDIRKRENDIPGMYSSHYHLSNYFLDEGHQQEAFDHAEKAYNLAKSLNSASYIENALSLLLDLSNNPEVLEYKKLSDSIAFAKQVQENKYAIIKYNVEKERQKTQAVELQNEREKRFKIMFLSAFLLAVMAIGFIVYRKNQQRKKERIVTTEKTEARISKKVHDELANDVSGVMNFVENNIDTTAKTKNKLLNFLNDIYIRARDISTSTAGVNVMDFTNTLKYLIAQHCPKGVEIITNPNTGISWNKIPDHKKKALYKCLQELLVNTKKHANASKISIVFKKVGKRTVIIYTDNGVGFYPKIIHTNGLKNVETRMQDIDGVFTFDSNEGKGFKAWLTF